MQNISSAIELKKAIQLLEIEQTVNRQLLKDQFLITYESLKPLNILKRTLKDIASSPNLVDNILGATVGAASGYLTKKIIVNSSGNIFRNLFGSILQFGITNMVAQHPDAIKSFGNFILQHITRKKEANSEKH